MKTKMTASIATTVAATALLSACSSSDDSLAVNTRERQDMPSAVSQADTPKKEYQYKVSDSLANKPKDQWTFDEYIQARNEAGADTGASENTVRLIKQLYEYFSVATCLGQDEAMTMTEMPSPYTGEPEMRSGFAQNKSLSVDSAWANKNANRQYQIQSENTARGGDIPLEEYYPATKFSPNNTRFEYGKNTEQVLLDFGQLAGSNNLLGHSTNKNRTDIPRELQGHAELAKCGLYKVNDVPTSDDQEKPYVYSNIDTRMSQYGSFNDDNSVFTIQFDDVSFLSDGGTHANEIGYRLIDNGHANDGGDGTIKIDIDVKNRTLTINDDWLKEVTVVE